MKHRRSIFLLLIITVVTLYCRVEFCYAAESSDITTRASTTATTAKTAGTAAELKALLTSSTDYTITLTADITISKKINIAGTKTIKGAGYKIIRNEGFTDARMLIVDAGSKLTLSDNLTVTGHRSKVESEAGIIKVESGGNLVVKDTVMINNNYSLSSGGGIYIKGTVTMSGGVITNSTCTGDGALG